MYFQIIPTVKVQNVGSHIAADSGPQCSVPSATPNIKVNHAIYMKFWNNKKKIYNLQWYYGLH